MLNVLRLYYCVECVVHSGVLCVRIKCGFRNVLLYNKPYVCILSTASSSIFPSPPCSSCGNDADFKGMLLFWIRPVAKEGGSADVLPAGRVALLLLTMHDFPVRQVYLHCQPQGSLEKGALVDISLDLESFSDIVQMSMWMVGLGHSFELWTLTF